MNVPALETARLRKRFGDKFAVADLSLTVARCEVFGFLGPNGAGETRFLEVMLGLVASTAGRGQVRGGACVAGGGGAPPRALPLPGLAPRSRVATLPRAAAGPWRSGSDTPRRGAARARGSPRRRRPAAARIQQGHDAARRAGPSAPQRAR